MNANKLKLLIFIAIVFSGNLYSQELDLSAFELEAHYPFLDDGSDLVDNYDDINLVDPIFSFGGIYSRGCYINELILNGSPECLIETPQLDPLNQLTYAISLDFRALDYAPNEYNHPHPIVVLGHWYRFLGLAVNETGTLLLLTNNYDFTEIDRVIIEQDIWYNATLIHNKLNSTTQVYINQELVFTMVEPLNHPTDDVDISNTDFSRGNAFHGYWKNLEVYSHKGNITQTNNSNSPMQFSIYPNPADRYLNLSPHFSDNKFNYSIVDMTGNLINGSKLINNSIDIQNLQSGIYILSIFDKNELLHRKKFIKI